MFNKYTIDSLNEKNVSVKTQQYTTVNGVDYSVGLPHRKAYVNSTSGRLEVQAELPTAQQNAIFAVWGAEPTVIDPE